MSSLPDHICPLCSQVRPREQIHEHIASEHPLLRLNTIKVIHAHHPWWSPEDGACEPCWKSFRDASRALEMLRHARQRNTYWNAPVFERRSPPAAHPIATHYDSDRQEES